MGLALLFFAIPSTRGQARCEVTLAGKTRPRWLNPPPLLLCLCTHGIGPDPGTHGGSHVAICPHIIFRGFWRTPALTLYLYETNSKILSSSCDGYRAAHRGRRGRVTIPRCPHGLGGVGFGRRPRISMGLTIAQLSARLRCAECGGPLHSVKPWRMEDVLGKPLGRRG